MYTRPRLKSASNASPPKPSPPHQALSVGGCFSCTFSAAPTGICWVSDNWLCSWALLTPRGGERPLSSSVSLQWGKGLETRPETSWHQQCYCFPRLSLQQRWLAGQPPHRMDLFLTTGLSGCSGVSHPLAGVQAPTASRNSPLCLGSPLSSGREAWGETLSRTEKARLFLELPQLSFSESSNGLDKPSEVPGCYSVPFVRLMNLLSHRKNTIS